MAARCNQKVISIDKRSDEKNKSLIRKDGHTERVPVLP